MSLIKREDIINEFELIGKFLRLQGKFFVKKTSFLLGWTGFLKEESAKLMYQRRGKFSQSFVNLAMGTLAFFVIALSGKLEEMMFRGGDKNSGSNYLIMATAGGDAKTIVSDSLKGDITEYVVEKNDTVASIAQKFNVTMDTIMWENNLSSVDALKPGKILRILPVVGVRYQTRRGETIYTIASKFKVDPQVIIDYPFNSFVNDETFSLAAGQELMIPDGIKPDTQTIDSKQYLAKTVAPIPGVVGEGNFMYPTNGMVTQRYSWYHRAVDIANRQNPAIVAAQGGTVVTAGWNGGGYGNYVVIDHGNGWQTLYGHLLNNSMVVKAGDRVKQGQKLGIMGSTGRSTGTHLHLEIKGPNGNIDPLTILK